MMPAMAASLKQRDHTPERTTDQRREALALASRVRAQRAALKLQLKQGSISIARLISDPPRCLGTANISEPLMALPGYGPVKVRRLLERCRVSPRKTVAGLNERQRRELIRALEKQAP
jgi:hypothetical protein